MMNNQTVKECPTLNVEVVDHIFIYFWRNPLTLYDNSDDDNEKLQFDHKIKA